MRPDRPCCRGFGLARFLRRKLALSRRSGGSVRNSPASAEAATGRLGDHRSYVTFLCWHRECVPVVQELRGGPNGLRAAYRILLNLNDPRSCLLQAKRPRQLSSAGGVLFLARCPAPRPLERWAISIAEDGQPRTDRSIYLIGFSLHSRLVGGPRVEFEGLSLARRGVSGDLQTAVTGLWTGR